MRKKKIFENYLIFFEKKKIKEQAKINKAKNELSITETAIEGLKIELKKFVKL
jgi:hypothetical protein